MSDVTFGVKMPEEFKLQIENLMKDSGVRTGKDFMQSLVNSYVLEKTKETIPEVAEDLKELQILTQRIDNIYLNLGYRIENLTKAQQEQQQQLLSKKDSIILDLQSKIDAITIKNNTLTDEYNNIVNQNSDHIKRVNELTESNNNIKALNEEYKSKVDTITGILEEYKGYKAENETVKGLLASQQADNVILKDSIKEKDFNINGLNKDIEKITTEHQQIIDTLKSEYIQKIQTNEDKAELEKQKSELKLQQLHQKTIEELNNKHNAAVEEHQNKYKELLEQMQEKQTKTTIAQKDKLERLKEKQTKTE